MSRDLKHQSLELTFKKVAELEFENDEDNNVSNNNFKKVGRNEKCPCGSGKKFKHCHGNV